MLAASSFWGAAVCRWRPADLFRVDGFHVSMKRNRTNKYSACLVQRLRQILPLFLFTAALEAQVLPPPPAVPEQREIAAETKLLVRAFKFEGNTAFSSAELAKIVEPFTNREITSDELEQARRA